MCSNRSGRRLLSFGALSLLGLLFLGACGKQGNPLPPLRYIPARTQDFAGIQQGTQLRFTFTYPKSTAAGLALAGLSGLEIWAVERPVGSDGLAPKLDPRELVAAARVWKKLSTVELAAVTAGDRVLLDVPLPETGKAYYLAARTLGPQGDLSEYSNLVILVPKQPPAPPEKVTLTERADGVLAEWTWTAPPAPAAETPAETAATAAPAGTEPPAAGAAVAEVKKPGQIAGFNVYRRSSRDKGYGPPIHASSPEEKTYLDTEAKFGERYIYAVTTVLQRDPMVESAIQTEQEVQYLDRFAPSPARELVALAEPTQVRLIWRASEAAEATGYNVYRQTGRGEFAKLTSAPIPDLAFTDTGVAAGKVYTYRVTALDAAGNESEPAETQAHP